MIAFAHPELLSLLLLLPLLALLRGSIGKVASIRYPSLHLLEGLGALPRTRLGAFDRALRLVAIALVIIAIARPQRLSGHREVEASGIDIMLVVDISTSMEALDFKIDDRPSSRISVVKQVVQKFIDARPNDRIGLVAFAGRPYLASPVTLDHDWLQARLASLHPGDIEDGTAIGSAIATATERLEGLDSKSKVLVLLTDGMNNAGKVSPLVAAEAARALNIKVYTIGAGTRGEAPIPVTDAFGQKRLAMSKVDIDEDTLRTIAQRTGGLYYRATDTDSLERIYDEINRLERTTRNTQNFEVRAELFPFVVALALMMLAAEQLVQRLLLRRLP